MSDPINNSEQKKQLRAISPSTVSSDPLALLDFGDLSLLVSSKDIFTLMSTQKITPPTLAQAYGEVVVDERAIPVFAINKALQLSQERFSNHLTLVLLQHEEQLFGLCCTTLEKIDVQDLNFFPVPINMSSRKQPFSQFAIVNNRAAGLTSAAVLFEMLQARGVVFPETTTNHIIQEAS